MSEASNTSSTGIAHNQFELRPEVIFIQYDGVMKDSNQFMINKLGNELYDDFIDYLHIEDFKGINMFRSMTASLQLTGRNLFEVLAKKELDYIATYNGVYGHYRDMFSKAHPLKIFNELHILLTQRFTDEIYIYHPIDDSRVTDDIFRSFGNNNKLTYVYGNFDEVLENLPKEVTTFMISDSDLIPSLTNYKKINYTDISVAQYRRNYYLGENDSIKMMHNIDDLLDTDKYAVRQTIFMPVDLTEAHFRD